MSIGRHEAKRQKVASNEAAASAKADRLKTEENLRRQKEKTQKLFINQARARSSGGLFFRSDTETLG
jgi:uncharacterized membrane protein YukC